MNNNKRVVITGGNSGIGFATAHLFKKSGYNVTIIGRDQAKLEQAAGDIQCDYLALDLNTFDQLNMAEKLYADGLDVLVNNAGVASCLPVEILSEKSFDEYFHTNVRAPLFLSKLLLPALALRCGSIINISSVITDNAKPTMSLYAATKGALESLTKSLAIEFADKNIRVNAVAPGAIHTPLINKLGYPEDQFASIIAQQEAEIPLNRLGKAEEIAEVILAQAESSYTTGAIWKVDGGVDAS
jgi:NAD(P)-dependent dehydrogenase (short-subunit alcohol dehydrogenase family)